MAIQRMAAQPGEDRINQQKQAAKASTDSHTGDSGFDLLPIAGLNARQSAVLRKQQTIGNTAVMRQLGIKSTNPNHLTGGLQRTPKDELPLHTDASRQETSIGAAESTNTIQRDVDQAVWTVPASVTAPLQAAQSSAVETEAYSQQMASSVQMATAGWSALVSTKINGAPPEPVRASGAAARSQLASTQGAAGKVTSSLDQARATLVAAIQQGGGDIAEKSTDNSN